MSHGSGWKSEREIEKKKKNERKRITIERENNSFIGDRMKHSSGLWLLLSYSKL